MHVRTRMHACFQTWAPIKNANTIRTCPVSFFHSFDLVCCVWNIDQCLYLPHHANRKFGQAFALYDALGYALLRALDACVHSKCCAVNADIRKVRSRRRRLAGRVPRAWLVRILRSRVEYYPRLPAGIEIKFDRKTYQDKVKRIQARKMMQETHSHRQIHLFASICVPKCCEALIARDLKGAAVKTRMSSSCTPAQSAEQTD